MHILYSHTDIQTESDIFYKLTIINMTQKENVVKFRDYSVERL
jgi:hypothetical protein